MINILYEPFPDSVTVGTQQFPVVTDFREWLKFAGLLRDDDVPARLKISFLADWFLHPPAYLTESHIKALLDFYHARELEYAPVSDEDRDDKQETPISPPVFDWTIDASCILGDFRRYYQIDLLRTEFLHWWEFKCLFNALPDESHCMKRAAYRGADLSKIKNKSEQTRIARIQKAIALPFEFTDEMIGDALMNAF